MHTRRAVTTIPTTEVGLHLAVSAASFNVYCLEGHVFKTTVQNIYISI